MKCIFLVLLIVVPVYNFVEKECPLLNISTEFLGGLVPVISTASNGNIQVTCTASQGKVVQVRLDRVNEPAQGTTNSVTLDLECIDGVYVYNNPNRGHVLYVETVACIESDPSPTLN